MLDRGAEETYVAAIRATLLRGREQLEQAKQEQARARAMIRGTVPSARHAGFTMAEIAELAGMSRQSLYELFDR